MFKSIRQNSMRWLFAFAFIVGLSQSAHAVPGALETAAIAAIGEGTTAATNVLVAVAALLAAFLLFKLIKRAINKV